MGWNIDVKVIGTAVIVLILCVTGYFYHDKDPRMGNIAFSAGILLGIIVIFGEVMAKVRNLQLPHAPRQFERRHKGRKHKRR